MLPKENRLKHRQDFNAVYRGGLRRTGGNLTLRALRRQHACQKNAKNSRQAALPAAPTADKPTRIGITISQKVSKKAVIRNRIKRQIRAALRELLPHLSSGWDFVIVVGPAAIKCNYGQFLQELEQLLAQAEVLNGHSRGSLL
ncbi:ribonuclease P protein component [Microcoleus sp. FACHB-672]|uniref:ribonuclease P protein component n=1 Tax=Microcoleus sp. FACHB-672 TaxID=2692825 RepID=UPI0016870E4C|nr:ribonuclease P protein component [Microcoleus sp. FACHB-672]MBD2040261.1 ribonuclease P protein component [Microcoleus sp. FACHB-672]